GGLHKREAGWLGVPFQCGIHSFSKWVCLQHRGYARDLASQFWRVMSGGTLVPATVDEALQRQDELTQVTHIRVAPEGERDWRIVGYRIDGQNFDGNLHRAIAWGRPEINDSIPY